MFIKVYLPRQSISRAHTRPLSIIAQCYLGYQDCLPGSTATFSLLGEDAACNHCAPSHLLSGCTAGHWASLLSMGCLLSSALVFTLHWTPSRPAESYRSFLNPGSVNRVRAALILAMLKRNQDYYYLHLRESIQQYQCTDGCRNTCLKTNEEN